MTHITDVWITVDDGISRQAINLSDVSNIIWDDPKIIEVYFKGTRRSLSLSFPHEGSAENIYRSIISKLILQEHA